MIWQVAVFVVNLASRGVRMTQRLMYSLKCGRQECSASSVCMRNVVKCSAEELVHVCRNGCVMLRGVCTMAAGFVSLRRSVVMVICGRYALKRTSAARNEGSDEPTVIGVQGIVARLSTTTIVDACRRARRSWERSATLLP